MNSTRKESRRRKELDSGGGISVLEEMLGEKNTSEIREKENIVQNDNYKSNVLNQFLPYANLLETIKEDTISRKRKTKNRKKTTPSISIIPTYEGGNILREMDFERGMVSNKNRLQDKRKKSKEDTNEDKRLQWYGDPITFTPEWPNPNERETI